MLTKLIIISSIVAGFAVSTAAQLRCDLTIANAPNLSGFRLGMSFADVQAALAPNIKVKPSKTGEGTVFESFAEQKPPGKLSDLNAFWLRLDNNKIYQIEVFYSGSGHLRIDDLIDRLSKQFKLPRDAWKTKNDYAWLDCGEFLLTADTLLNSHVELTDSRAKAEFDKKLAEQKSKKKKKP
jgi:hypothetical protein